MFTLDLQQTTVDFLRHGEVQGKACFRGRTDDPLTEHGWQQMFQQCQGYQWDSVICSPLRRCESFASAWGQEHQIEVIADPGWMEMDFGEWEGLDAEQVGQVDPDGLQRFYSDPLNFTPPHAESYLHFAARIRHAWEKILKTYAGQTLLVVTHAGVIRVLYAQLLDIEPRNSFQIEVPHACLTRFSCFDDENGRFVQLNFHKPI